MKPLCKETGKPRDWELILYDVLSPSLSLPARTKKKQNTNVMDSTMCGEVNAEFNYSD
jgi:hypothetical protein